MYWGLMCTYIDNSLALRLTVGLTLLERSGALKGKSAPPAEDNDSKKRRPELLDLTC